MTPAARKAFEYAATNLFFSTHDADISQYWQYLAASYVGYVEEQNDTSG